MFSSCKSHQKMEESSCSSIDSVYVRRGSISHTVAEIGTQENITLGHSNNHIEFNDTSAEMLIHPDGKVLVKGLKSADIVMDKTTLDSHHNITYSDSTATSDALQSQRNISSRIKQKTDAPKSSGTWLYLTFVLSAILLIILNLYYYRKK